MIKNQKGITFVEVLVVISIFIILFSAILLVIDPVSIQKKGRDDKRISDLSVLDRIINEFLVDNGSYPDLINTTRSSIILPEGNTGPLESSTSGWIDQNLSLYEVKLPIDPTNDATYNYKYRHTPSGYELNATLEYYTDRASSDGGNNLGVYEIGNDLTIL